MEIRVEHKLAVSEITTVMRAVSKADEEFAQVFTTGEENSENNLSKKHFAETLTNNPVLLKENSNYYFK
jgi:hypothetical protein